MQQKLRELSQILVQYIRAQQISDQPTDRLVDEYYKVSFLSPVRESTIKKILPSDVKKSQLKLDTQRYIMEQWGEIIPKVSQFRFQSLAFNDLAGILGQIRHIRLVGLKSLNLSSCLIQGVQPFAEMDFPHLKTLNLSFNAIVSLRPLRKINAFELQTLNISDNCIVSLHPLAEMKTRRNMSALILEQSGFQDIMVEDGKVEDIHVLWKMQARTIRKLKMQSFERVSRISFTAHKHHRFQSHSLF